jgi:REP element-mobilizing transposase RayT
MIVVMALFRSQYRVKSARLENWDYSAAGWYFVTICTHKKACSMGRSDYRTIVLSEAGLIAATEMELVSGHYSNVLVDRFVIMPNHLHAIIVIEGPAVFAPSELKPGRVAVSLSTIVGSYKAGVRRICGIRGILNFEWQMRFHDHILRSNASLNSVRDYIDHNPQNWLDDPDNTSKPFAAGDAASRVSTYVSGVKVLGVLQLRYVPPRSDR